jgi:hypothetical protein
MNLPDRTFPDRPIAHFPIARSHISRSPGCDNRMQPSTTRQGRTPHRAVSLPQKIIAHFSQTSPKSPIPSNRRKCTRPDRSPATTVTPSGKIAQQSKPESPLKLAISLPLSRSQIFRVLSLKRKSRFCRRVRSPLLYPVSMTGEGSNFGTCLGVPDFQGFIP